MGLVLGLGVFTACYGHTPGWQYDESGEPLWQHIGGSDTTQFR